MFRALQLWDLGDFLNARQLWDRTVFSTTGTLKTARPAQQGNRPPCRRTAAARRRACQQPCRRTARGDRLFSTIATVGDDCLDAGELRDLRSWDVDHLVDTLHAEHRGNVNNLVQELHLD